MTKREIKKCTHQIIDLLYEQQGFQDWWNSLDDRDETKIENAIQSIIESRLKDK